MKLPPSRKLAARILSAFVWNREARHAFRDALIHDYASEINELRKQLTVACENAAVFREETQKLFETIKTLNGGTHISRPSMPYCIEGKNNRVFIVEKNGRERLLGKEDRIPGIEISIFGDDNEIRIHETSKLNNDRIEIGKVSQKNKNNGVRIEIGERATIHNMYIRCQCGERQKFAFGCGSRIWGGEVILDEESGCLIGDDCNCSNDIHIWGSDGHAILDKNDTAKILNEVDGPITVGDHSWIGQSVRLQKGARIPANSIVGAGAIVTKAFAEEFTVLAGVPAKVIKRGVMRDPLTRNPWTIRRQNAQKH